MTNAVAQSVSPSISQWRMLADDLHPTPLPSGMDTLWATVEASVQLRVPRRQFYMRWAEKITLLQKLYQTMSDSKLHQTALDMQTTFRLGRDNANDLFDAYALICEVVVRQLDMQLHKVQIAAALAINANCCAELATGEGKTLAATLPATVAGWRGRGCHILTVNDYLAQRDAEWMGPIYKFCGNRVAFIQQEMDPVARRAAYAADITYTTNKEVAADFLRDRLILGQTRGLSSVLLDRMGEGPAAYAANRLVQRGLEFAIVDEADSILIDEAVTPLIISGDGPNAERIEAFEQAAKLASELECDTDFKINHRWREVKLTQHGHEHLDELCEKLGGIWAGRRRREELVTQALTASHLHQRGQQYVVQYDEEDKYDKVVIVDEFTGRLMPDRTWRDGLHQAVEAKESLKIQPLKQTLARISFQRFFRLYRKLAGMTGTAWESRYEMWQIYRMPVVRIPTNRPCIRKHKPECIHANADDRWAAVVDEIKRLHEQGCPVLVGTRSVEASEHLSQLLMTVDLDHKVLNAVRHKEEAQIITEAGQLGRITIATNMAGRGTDIKLGRGVVEVKGLHVIATERHEAGRIDRQLFGRSGRQGDPGCSTAIVSCEDELIRRHLPAWGKRLLRSMATGHNSTSGRTARMLFKYAQIRAQNNARRQRRSVLRHDEWLDENLSFAGKET